MATTLECDDVEFSLDPSDAAMLADPYPAINRLREADPLHWSPLGFWIATRYEDVRSIVMDRENFGQGDFIRNIQLYYGPDFDVMAHPSYRWLSEVFVYQDPPRHTRLRALVTQALNMRRVQAMRPRIQAITDELIDRVADQGHMEVIRDFAYRMPTMVMCDMLGIDRTEADDDLLGKLNQAIADSFLVLEMRALRPEELELADRQITFLEDFFHAIFEKRRKEPRDDLATDLIQAREEGGSGLTEREMVTVAVGLFGAGFETTAHIIGNGLLTLHRNPDQWQALVDDQSLAAGAAEEILRFESSLTATYRTAFADREMHGKTIKEGQRVLLMIAGGNHDPRVFTDPDRFDIRRAEAKPLSFGGGIHFCVGAELARMETTIALTTLAHRLPTMRIDTSEPAWRGLLFRGLTRLEATWPQGSARPAASSARVG
jgi:cytochrome P450